MCACVCMPGFFCGYVGECVDVRVCICERGRGCEYVRVLVGVCGCGCTDVSV